MDKFRTIFLLEIKFAVGNVVHCTLVLKLYDELS